MSSFSALQKYGLLNTHTDYLDVVGVERKVFIAWCSSLRCTNSTKTSVQKEVASNRSFCPDCNSALFWQRRKSNLGRPPNKDGK